MKIELKAQDIQENWKVLVSYIDKHIESSRKEKLLKFYNKHQDELDVNACIT